MAEDKGISLMWGLMIDNSMVVPEHYTANNRGIGEAGWLVFKLYYCHCQICDLYRTEVTF